MKKFITRYRLFQTGQVIPGLVIHGQPAPYPVVNERAVRAGAGIMLVLGLFAFFQAFYLAEYLFLKILVIAFFIDFLLKVIVGNTYSPVSQLANLIVRKQEPEYVGAIQKRFAWSIGLALSSVMVILIFSLGIIGPINLAICALCLAFMFMESAFGICVGCNIYSFLLAKNIIATPAIRPSCAGNVCSIE